MALFLGKYSPSSELKSITSSATAGGFCVFEDRDLARNLARSAISWDYDGTGGALAGSVSCMIDEPGRKLELWAVLDVGVTTVRGARSNGSCCLLSRLDNTAKYAGEFFTIGRGLGRPEGFEAGLEFESPGLDVGIFVWDGSVVWIARTFAGGSVAGSTRDGSTGAMDGATHLTSYSAHDYLRVGR